jgi:[acyl-carrier-protein] S-malonyltransferase
VVRSAATLNSLQNLKEANKMLVVLCPGQGSQTPGFLSPWLELDSFASSVASLSEASGIDIAKHGTESDADTIRDTAVAQPLIVAASIASALELGSGFGAVAGHSVGEFAAAALAGILTPEDAIRAVSVRSRAMAAAAALEPTSMAAVLGGEQSVVLERLEQLDLYPANFNGAGQIVAAGSAEAISALVAEGPAGARVIQLQVAGAFHTRYMEPAVAELAGFAAGLTTSTPTRRIWSNQAGQEITDGREYVDLLVGQVASSVRWDTCMQSFADAGVTGVLEVSPAGALAGLAKRALPGVEILALKTPDQLDAARELIANHS